MNTIPALLYTMHNLKHLDGKYRQLSPCWQRERRVLSDRSERLIYVHQKHPTSSERNHLDTVGSSNGAPLALTLINDIPWYQALHCISICKRYESSTFPSLFYSSYDKWLPRMNSLSLDSICANCPTRFSADKCSKLEFNCPTPREVVKINLPAIAVVPEVWELGLGYFNTLKLWGYSIS